MPFQAIAAHPKKRVFSRKIGPLQSQLQKGEYGFFKYSPMFESDFVQISKYGSPVEITNEEEIVTIGVSFSNPVLLIPDVLLVARPIYLPKEPVLWHNIKLYPQCKVNYELNRLLPLRLVRISVHNVERQQLRFKLVSGRTFYLQLCPEAYRREYLFDSWTRIIKLLWPPRDTMSEMKQMIIESSRIWSFPAPRPKAPSPKRPMKSKTVWSELFFTKGRLDEKGKTSKTKSPKSLAKAQHPAPPPKAKGLAEEKRRRSTKESHSSRSKSGQRC